MGLLQPGWLSVSDRVSSQSPGRRHEPGPSNWADRMAPLTHIGMVSNDLASFVTWAPQGTFVPCERCCLPGIDDDGTNTRIAEKNSDPLLTPKRVCCRPSSSTGRHGASSSPRCWGGWGRDVHSGVGRCFLRAPLAHCSLTSEERKRSVDGGVLAGLFTDRPTRYRPSLRFW